MKFTCITINTHSTYFVLFSLSLSTLHSYSQRGCRFASDGAKNETKRYFRSNCISECRLKSIIALCNCYPFYFQDSVFDNSTKACTLENIHCLNHFNCRCIYIFIHSHMNYIAWINQQVNTLKFNCSFFRINSYVNHLNWMCVCVYRAQHSYIDFSGVCFLCLVSLGSQMDDTAVFTWNSRRCWTGAWKWFIVLALSTLLHWNTVFDFIDQITIANINGTSTERASLVSLNNITNF